MPERNSIPQPSSPPSVSAEEVFAPEQAGFSERIALGVEYLGSHYSGFQSQANASATIQQCLETAIGSVANHPVRLHCAGRTDAGVHATNQVVHFDTRAHRKPYGWLLGVNTRLPADISLQWVKPTAQDFHARFMAQARRYRYVIYNHVVPSGILARNVTWERRPLDVKRMQTAAGQVLGRHDFSSFRAAECQAKSPVRTVHHCKVSRHGKLIVIDVRADAFLHHMVRNIAGVLMAIGSGDAAPDWVTALLAARSRRAGGVTARPEGLYLVGAEYDPRFQLPEPALGPAFLGLALNGEHG